MNRNKMFVAGFMLMFLLLVGSTMAYLTDIDSKTNVFTFGNVNIELTEPHWVAADGLNIIPGQVLPKDPKITNTGSTNAYVVMQVDFPCVNNKLVFTYTVNSGWTTYETPTCSEVGTAQGIYYYGNSTTMTSLAPNASTPTLFDSVTIASLNDYEIDQLPTEINMNITGMAVQADGDNTGHGHSDTFSGLVNVFYPIA
jgi:predicted ribosomally synthesized peptide with SipW-like signal peptide